jgi:hypothetical protein
MRGLSVCHIRLGRKAILVSMLAILPLIFVAGYYRFRLHPMGEDLFNNWSHNMRQAATPIVRLSVDLAHRVQEWEKDLYTSFQSGDITRGELGECLQRRYEVSPQERDLNAWIARMGIYTDFLRFFGVWLYAPNTPMGLKMVLCNPHLSRQGS